MEINQLDTPTETATDFGQQIPSYPKPAPGLSRIGELQAVADTEAKQQTIRDQGNFFQSVREQDWVDFDTLFATSEVPFDRSWEGPTPDQYKATKLPEEFYPKLSGSLSQDDFFNRASKITTAMQNEETLAAYGVKGAFMRFGLDIIAPENFAAIGIAALTPNKVIPLAETIARMGRAGSALKYGVLAAGENAAIQAAVNQSNPLGDGETILKASLFGMAFGGALGGTFHRTLASEIEGHALRVLESVEAQRAGTVGAMQATGPMVSHDMPAISNILTQGSTEEAAFGAVRFDASSKARNAGLETATRAADIMMNEGVGGVNKGVMGRGGTVTTLARQNMKTFVSLHRRAVEPIYDKWLRANSTRGERLFSQVSKREEFNRMVFRQMHEDLYTDPHVIAGANAYRPLYAEMLKKQKEAGVYGTDKVDFDSSYVTRQWQPLKLREAVLQNNRPTIVGLFHKSLINGKTLDDTEIEHMYRVAEAVVVRMEKRSGFEDITGFNLNMNDADTLSILLRESGQVDDDLVDTIVRAVTKSKDKAGGPSHLKRRMDLDMTVTVPSPKGGKELSLYDLVEDDIEKVTTQYMMKASGLTAMANKGIGVTRNADADLDDIWRAIQNEGNHKGMAQNDIDNTINSIKHVADMSLGRPYDGASATAAGRGMTAFMDAAYIRYMGQTGWASLAELGNAIGYAGAFNVARSLFPVIRDMAMEARKGGFEARSMALEMESLGIAAGHGLNNKAHARFFDHDTEFYSKAFKTMSNGLQVGKRLTTKYSGLALVTDFSQQLAARAFTQKMFNMATRASKEGGFEKLWAKEQSRFHYYGVDEGMAKKMFANILKYSDTIPSSTFKSAKIARINPHKWDNPKELDEFTQTMFRMTTHAIQETDGGNLAPWMNNLTVRMLLQFRSFISGAYTRATLHALHHRDIESGIAAISSMGIAWSAYVLQNSINSVGHADDWLDKRLTPERQLAAGFARSSFSSFAPAGMDFILNMAGEDSFFNYTRSSGQAQLTSPAMEIMTNMWQAKNLLATPGPREATESDVDALLNLLPNLHGVRNLVAAIDDGTELPYKQEN